MNNMAVKVYDIVIIGGGLAGLSLAIQLKRRMPDAPLSIAVIERNTHTVPDAAHKVGESLVELSAHYFSDVLGLKEHLISDQLPKLGLRFFFKNEDTENAYQTRLEKSVEFGAKKFPDSPSYQLDRGIFENHLAKTCQSLGVDFIDGTKVVEVDISEGSDINSVTATHLETKQTTVYQCRWMIDACSRTSPVKRQLNLAEENDHKVSSAWFRIGTKMDITDFSQNEKWRNEHQDDNSRWFSTNHFMGEGYWLWFIPLSSGSTSIGIVADNNYHPLETYNTMEKALEWLYKHEPLCAEHIENNLDQLQDFKALRNFSHSCKQVYSKDRWFLTGESGVFLDPFYSPGSDFIAMSNTFICNLIEDDYNDNGEFEKNCFILNIFYLNIYKNTSKIYIGQYAVFGNANVMPIKILWDFGVYWSFNAFLYIQGKFVDTQGLFSIRKHLEELGSMNMKMQPFFIEWAKLATANSQQHYIDPFSFPFLEELNVGLYQKLDNEAFEKKFMENIKGIKELYQSIIDAALIQHPELTAPENFMPSHQSNNIFTQLINTIKAA